MVVNYIRFRRFLPCREAASSGRPASLPECAAGNCNFALHPDGKRFAVVKDPGAMQNAAVNKVNFIFNFFDEVRRKVPVGK